VEGWDMQDSFNIYRNTEMSQLKNHFAFITSSSREKTQYQNRFIFSNMSS